MMKIVLASGSPRRKMLLDWAEIPFIVHPSDADETMGEIESPESFAMELAMKKADIVSRKDLFSKGDHIFIGADTIVLLNDLILGKPHDRSDAIDMLNKLSGQTHQVITGVSVISKDKRVRFFESTDVSFVHLSQDQIEHYIDHYAPYDKAGSYAIQEWIGVIGIQSIKGDFYNVMGLPVNRLVRLLHDEFLLKS